MEQPDVATAWPAPPKYYLEARRRPPPPPPDGPISMYGIARAPLGETPPAAPLEKQLYELGSVDPCGELRKLNHTLLSTFLALLQTAQDTPSQCHVRVDEMRHLMLNMQHLLNTFRPYQAREELISIAQAQVDAKRALLEQCRRAISACAVCQDGDALGSGSAAAAAPLPQAGASSFASHAALAAASWGRAAARPQTGVSSLASHAAFAAAASL